MSHLAVLSIDLLDVEPRVHRKITVPLDIRLDRLHLVIQKAMPWTNAHLYELLIGGGGWGAPDPFYGSGGPMDASKETLGGALAGSRRKTFSYIYDFGDGWDHQIKLERTLPAIEGSPRIELIEAVGRCPPEDSGGPWGYMEMLRILSDPDDEEYEDTLMWIGQDYDPQFLDEASIKNGLAGLDRRWMPRKRTPRRP